MSNQIKPGDVVLFRPAELCPPMWRPLAEHLEGRSFQYIAKAQGWVGETLVLQPRGSLELFPSYFLAPAECLWPDTHQGQREAINWLMKTGRSDGKPKWAWDLAEKYGQLENPMEAVQ